jgi:glycosyltransferase involved in cell wall biosynthesis
MKILILAPQPFYQERGTPIAVRLLLEVLAENYPEQNSSPNIHLVTYHEGTDVTIHGVRHTRIKALSFLRDIKPGISVKKVIADFFFLLKTLKVVWQARHEQFAMIHAIEESVFIAWFIRLIFGIPYVYDMDSSLSRQMTERWRAFKCLLPVLEFLESVAIKGSIAVIPVCDALADDARSKGAKSVHLLTDVAVIGDSPQYRCHDLKAELDIPKDSEIVLYVGNLQPYQGVELLVDSFLKVAADHPNTYLVVIGGSSDDRKNLTGRIPHTETGSRIILAGTRPFESVGSYLAHAQVVASPRIEGNNTPMKIYNYLASGRAILATKILSHTQVLNDEVAFLCEPTIDEMAKGLSHLLSNKEVRSRIGEQGSILARTKYTRDSFRDAVIKIYSDLEGLIRAGT